MASPSAGLSHDGQTQAREVLKALEQHAAKMTCAALRARMLCMVSGDGAVARGGPSARHSGTAAANLFAQQLYPNEPVEFVLWEPFHRSEAAFRWTLANHDMVQEVFAVGRAMAQQFGCGTGRAPGPPLPVL